MATRRAIVAVVGRPNVGKSTLFNRLVGRRNAIVEDVPGVTRDRKYADAEWGDTPFLLVDTGGLDPESEELLTKRTASQAWHAIDEADVIVFGVDSREGVTRLDREVWALLRRAKAPTFLVANKVDQMEDQERINEFYELGAEHVMPLSAEHGLGVRELCDAVVEAFPEECKGPLPPPPEDDENGPIRIAVVGRPNVGKSSLINRLLGEERVISHDAPGTTRDAIDIPFERDGRQYILIDTAGIRRKRAVTELSEKVGVLQAFDAIDRAHVVLFLLDSTEPATDQDLRVAGYAHEKSRAVIIVPNKWDLVKETGEAGGFPTEPSKFEGEIYYRFKYLTHAPIHRISAKTGQRVSDLFPLIDKVYAGYARRVGTGELNQILEQITEENSPPVIKGKRLKFFFASQPATRPPTIVISTNYPAAVHFSYRRHLVNRLRELGGFTYSPIQLVLRKK